MRHLIFAFLISFSPVVNAQSVGWKYHEYLRKARQYDSYSYSKVMPDSALFFYEKAIELDLEACNFDHNYLTLSMALMDRERVRAYLFSRAAEGMTWSDAKYFLSWSKQQYYPYERFRELGYEIIKWETKLDFFCSKKEFMAAYQPEDNSLRNEDAIQTLKKAVRNRERGEEEKDAERHKRYFELWDQKIINLLDSLGRIPGRLEVGGDAHYWLNAIIQTWTADKILPVLPLFIEAIQSGEYLLNEGVAKAIDRCANFDGEYILMDNGAFFIYDDKSFEIDGWGYYGYLGEYHFSNELKYTRDRFVSPPIHPFIDREDIDALRKMLCLDTFENHLLKKRSYIVKGYIFEENLELFEANLR